MNSVIRKNKIEKWKTILRESGNVASEVLRSEDAMELNIAEIRELLRWSGDDEFCKVNIEEKIQDINVEDLYPNCFSNQTSYNISITIVDENECAKYDPLGLCTVDDCMHCKNSRVRIIREKDCCTLRDDFKNDINAEYVKNHHSVAKLTDEQVKNINSNVIKFLEETLGIKMSPIGKFIISRTIKKEECKDE